MKLYLIVLYTVNWFSSRNILNFSQLDRSKHIKVQGLGYSTPIEDNNMETIFPKSSQGFSNVDHCAPDTLDHMQGIAYQMFQCNVVPT